MYVKSIVLDGFKSYGNRVEITGFDPEFNAITGLNGTGKSNILDSICFVLGITNLSNVRAGSLQELIYKNGQAGITKATVSITFDNRDKNQCPIGYENHDEITVTRQVVMGGKNKYLINGINVQNKRVSDLFCSVQLNVNNPHFLIMQGRITKVLNMKPPEILSMVEEAAGTRMYEAKKQAAQKTIEKKDAKLRELNDIIKEDIAPKLQKLQDERSQFQEYQKVVRELENLTRLHVAYTYVSAEESAKEAEGKVTEVRDSIQSMKDTIQNNKAESITFDKEIAELSKKLDEESGSALRELQGSLSSLEGVEAAAAAAARAARDQLTGHERRQRLAATAAAEDQDTLAAKQAALDQVSSTFEKLKSQSEESEAALTEAQQRFLAVSSGLEGASESLQDQLMAAKAQASEASTRVSQSSMEHKHAAARLAQLRADLAGAGDQHHADTAVVDRLTKETRQIQSQLGPLAETGARYSGLQERRGQLLGRARQASSKVEQLAGRAQRAAFHYTDPEPGFDRRRVYGTLCKLFDVTDPLYCMALETSAGGRLYNVVVDTDATSKLVLQRGQLQSRTTIIPLNKISGQVIDRRTVQLAQDVGGGPENVQLALDLVTYPSELRAAMQWVFGGTLVCRDLHTARAVAFHAGVRRRAVTWDGDVVDPSGTLTGGARAKGGSVLVQIQQLKEAEKELSEVTAELQQVEQELSATQRDADKYAALQNRYEIITHELKVAETRLANTAHAQLKAEIETLNAKVESLSKSIEEDKKEHAAAAERAKELQDKVKDIKGHREREFKKAEAELKKAKKAAEEHSTAWKKREQEFESLRLEVDELRAAATAAAAALEAAQTGTTDLRAALDIAQKQHQEATTAVKEVQTRIKKQKAEIASRSGDIAKLQQKKEALQKQNADFELKIKEQDYKVKELQTEAADCAKRIKSLESEHGWISSERQYFGLSGGLYDFPARHAAQAGARRHALAATRDKLARGLNARAHTLLGKEEEQYQDVMRKKKIVEADRAKLVQVMGELDEKKRRTLVGACEQVNKDFASIFSTLLPGAHAKLAPPPGRGVLDGLEVKVGFNSVWKESLGELSGGQRSLVALSLVLAMLLFKPAPLYILDEVDAALDLSHTQNIGRMLKNHFTHSQFIIVSLKDGMFNNANVLFRTKFVDGMSSVQRTVNQRR